MCIQYLACACSYGCLSYTTISGWCLSICISQVVPLRPRQVTTSGRKPGHNPCEAAAAPGRSTRPVPASRPRARPPSRAGASAPDPRGRPGRGTRNRGGIDANRRGYVLTRSAHGCRPQHLPLVHEVHGTGAASRATTQPITCSTWMSSWVPACGMSTSNPSSRSVRSGSSPTSVTSKVLKVTRRASNARRSPPGAARSRDRVVVQHVQNPLPAHPSARPYPRLVEPPCAPGSEAR